MKLKFLFFFLALLLTAVWTILLVLTLKERGALFYIGEGVITFSLVFLVYFYRKVVKPLDIIGNGMELLREQDFSSRLTPVGQKEADRIVLVFNRMMEQLKDERLRLREQNHFLDLLVSASPMGVVILTLDGHISMKSLVDINFRGKYNVNVIAIEGEGGVDGAPDPTKPIKDEENLVLIGKKDDLVKLRK